jgi:hypothetical protein
LHDSVVLLRRYDPQDGRHLVTDQATGHTRFASSIWHDEGSAEGDEYSVFDDGVLARLGVARNRCVERRYAALASLSVAQVRSCRGSNLEPDQLDALADPLERDPASPTDPAHAVIAVAATVTAKQRYRVRSQLASRLVAVALT